MFFLKKFDYAFEEDCKIIKSVGELNKKISVFYNPEMKFHRDLILVLLKTYFKNKKIDFCDGMIGSGVLEIRLLKKLDIFRKLYLGDIKNFCIKTFQKNLKINKIKSKNIEIKKCDFNNLLSLRNYDFIHIDPFGPPTPFLDLAFQKIKHNGILSITATDSAVLCSKYRKTLLRRYKVKQNIRTYCDDDLGQRHLIKYCYEISSTYDKSFEVLLSFKHKHYFKLFLKVFDTKNLANQNLEKLSYLNYDFKTQKFSKKDFGEIGKTYIQNLSQKSFLKSMLENIDIIEDNKKVQNFLNLKMSEIDVLGFINIHKFCKNHKINLTKKIKDIILEIEKKGFLASKVFEDDFSIKTNCPTEILVKILKND